LAFLNGPVGSKHRLAKLDQLRYGEGEFLPIVKVNRDCDFLPYRGATLNRTTCVEEAQSGASKNGND
jgi:hypothetical protein